MPAVGAARTLPSVTRPKVSKVSTGRKRSVRRVVAPSDGVPLDAVRRLAAVRAQATSVNRVASEIGVTARGLSLFLEGSKPYSPTRTKLLRWYIREVGRTEFDVDAETARAALQVLMHALPPERHRLVEQQAIAWWMGVYVAEGVVPPPAWLIEVEETSSER